MKKAICSFIYYKILGWKSKITVPEFDKYIVCVAPHTSNIDLLIGKLVWAANGRKSGFMMKKSWFFWPLGYIFKAMGGVPVDRKKSNSLVEQMVDIAKKSKTFHLAITPEGTRKRNPNWKKGFYYIAKGAGIPIILAGVDYTKN
jgi:1-acyl-sn-glycerol-3-phosphate acyltransferase